MEDAELEPGGPRVGHHNAELELGGPRAGRPRAEGQPDGDWVRAAITFARSRSEAPRTSSVLTSRSMETVGSPPSIFATLD